MSLGKDGGGPPAPASSGGSLQMSPTSLDSFARAVLRGIGAPETDENLNAIFAWAQAEGGDVHNRAKWNPLNTTQNMSGASSINSVGVRRYTSFQQGVEATVKTLLNGHYHGIISAFRSGRATSVDIATQVAHSPWGTGTGVLRVLSSGKVLAGGTELGVGSNQQIYYQVFDGKQASSALNNFHGGGGSGSGSGMGGSGYSSYSNQPKWDQKEFEQGLAEMGFAARFLKSDPELYRLFQKAIKEHWDPGKFENGIKATKWWSSRTQTQRAYDEQRYADTTNVVRQNKITAANLIHGAAEMGFTLDPDRAYKLAIAVNRNGMSTDEQQAMLAGEIHYNPKTTYGGTFGQTMEDIKKLGQDYNVKLVDGTVAGWAQKVVAGKATAEQYEEWVKKQAIAKYPWLKDQITAGLSVADIASPFKAEMANILEVDPAAIETDDPNVLKGLQYRDPTDTKGAYTTMPIYEYQKMLRRDPRWLKTNNARDHVMDVGTSVLKDFGLI